MPERKDFLEGYVELPERIWRKVEVADCWTWTGAVAANGYGITWIAPRTRVAHRTIYEALVGPIPDGLDLDHLCRNRRCVNPDHLEPVTRSVNIRRGPGNGKRRLTHCPSGHSYDAANTKWYEGRRYCRACHNATGQRARDAKRAA